MKDYHKKTIKEIGKILLGVSGVLIIINFGLIGANKLYESYPFLFARDLDNEKWLEFLGIFLGILGSFLIYWSNRKYETNKQKIQDMKVELDLDIKKLAEIMDAVDFYTTRIICENINFQKIDIKNIENTQEIIIENKKILFNIHKKMNTLGLEVYLSNNFYKDIQKLHNFCKDYCDKYLSELINCLNLYQIYIPELKKYESIILEENTYLQLFYSYDKQIGILDSLIKTSNEFLSVSQREEYIKERKKSNFEKNNLSIKLAELGEKKNEISNKIAYKITPKFIQDVINSLEKIEEIEKILEQEKRELSEEIKRYIEFRKKIIDNRE